MKSIFSPQPPIIHYSSLSINLFFKVKNKDDGGFCFPLLIKIHMIYKFMMIMMIMMIMIRINDDDDDDDGKCYLI